MARIKDWVRTGGLVTSADFMPYATGSNAIPLGIIHAPTSASTLIRTIVWAHLVVTPNSADFTPPYNWQGRSMARFYASYQSISDTSWLSATQLSSDHVVGLGYLEPHSIVVDASAPLGSGLWSNPAGIDVKGMRKPPSLAENATVRIAGLWSSADSMADVPNRECTIAWLWTAACLFESPF